MVSIVIPVYNVAPYLLECIRSVISQSYQDVEVVIVDDCSTDNSISLIRDFVNDYVGPVRFKVIQHSINKGLSSSRNTGIENASGDYLYFLDADDYIHETAIERLVEAIEKDSSYGIAISYFCAFSEGNGYWTYRQDWLFDEPKVIEPDEFCYMMLTEKVNYTATAKLYKRELFASLRFQVGKRNEDTLLNVDMTPVIENNQIKCISIPDYSYFYRQRTGSICHNVNYPIEIDIISNYEYAKKKLFDKKSVCDWITKRQLILAISLLRSRHADISFPYSIYRKCCTFLSKYQDGYVRVNMAQSDYVLFMRFKYAPNLYRIFCLMKRSIFH